MPKKSGIGSHTKPNRGEYDVWLTPRAILSVLGEFDLDPCAAPEPRPWTTARRHITLPDDGLAETWTGRMWLNPPYGNDIGDWLRKMEGCSGIALIFARTETDAWQTYVWPRAKAVLFIAGRLHFCYPDGTKAKGNAGGPSALIAYSDFDAAVLRQSGIKGRVVTPDDSSCQILQI